jgi:hypothetical protein
MGSFRRIAKALEQIACILERIARQPGRTKFLLHQFKLIGETMILLPPHKTFSNLKTQLNTISTLPDGTPDAQAVVTVTSSAPDQVGIETNPAGGYYVTTPGDTGSATILIRTTSPAAFYEDVSFDFSYGPPPAGVTSVVIGADVPDTP